jgi:hypothetical protein
MFPTSRAYRVFESAQVVESGLQAVMDSGAEAVGALDIDFHVDPTTKSKGMGLLGGYWF